MDSCGSRRQLFPMYPHGENLSVRWRPMPAPGIRTFAPRFPRARKTAKICECQRIVILAIFPINASVLCHLAFPGAELFGSPRMVSPTFPPWGSACFAYFCHPFPRITPCIPPGGRSTQTWFPPGDPQGTPKSTKIKLDQIRVLDSFSALRRS